MKVIYRNREYIFDKDMCVSELLNELKCKSWIFISVNGKQLLEKEYDTTIIHEGDTVKIIRPLAGG